MSMRVRRGGKWVNATTQQILDKTLSLEDVAADAKAVGDRIDDIPVVVQENEYGEKFTEIKGLRQVKSIKFSKVDDVVAVTTSLEGGVELTSRIFLDINNYPIKIEINDLDCELSWEGFE